MPSSMHMIKTLCTWMLSLLTSFFVAIKKIQIDLHYYWLILHALAKQPEDRFPSIADFSVAFEQATQSSPNLLLLGSDETVASDIHIRATLAISQGEALAGTNRVITLPGGQHINVNVPA